MAGGRAEPGGNDSGKHFDPKAMVFTHILNSEDDLELSATSTQLSLTPALPAPGGN
ncbi:hypothetical protein [Pseudomonas aeruginosa]|uniref:Uncharacterized protein ORF SG89 n=1 Tax=Pseudomonas aeruginosa TaxID=287 RepID=Q8GPR4_PSEAI|nr:hypothetical protein [Pseudomonas aeruginosa]AAN62310.1 conserved hypothetical protein [Pseudomonas aeruginosa]UFK75748.1 hypothetical protein K0E51_12665 [Pseudomonas aeruginosa SG17M]WCW40247.1 hypothetical protein KK209_11630 [Pseudomonas aeruginosa]